MPIMIEVRNLQPGHVIVELQGTSKRVSEVHRSDTWVVYHAGVWSDVLSPHSPVWIACEETTTLRVCRCGHLYTFDHDKVEADEMVAHSRACARPIRLYSRERIMS